MPHFYFIILHFLRFFVSFGLTDSARPPARFVLPFANAELFVFIFSFALALLLLLFILLMMMIVAVISLLDESYFVHSLCLAHQFSGVNGIAGRWYLVRCAITHFANFNNLFHYFRLQLPPSFATTTRHRHPRRRRRLRCHSIANLVNYFKQHRNLSRITIVASVECMGRSR